MSRTASIILALAAAAGVFWVVLRVEQPTPPASPAPAAPAPKAEPVCPGPDCPKPAPRPKKPRSPWGAEQGPVGPLAPLPKDGVVGEDEPAVDLLAMPPELRPNNVGGRDGAGLCVFTSIMYAARWQNEPLLANFQAQMRAELGGGYPSKVDKMIAKYGPGTRYLQYEGNDPSIIEAALATGRPVSITWGGNHMLSCVALTADKGAIVDNNKPHVVQWFPRATFLSKWRQGGKGWVVVLLAPRPPAPPSVQARPHNLDGVQRPRRARPHYGVSGLAWRKGPPRYSLNGRAVPRPKALRAVGAAIGDGLPDDAAKASLTAIGAGREKVLADLDAAPELAPWRGKVLAQGYAPTDWAVSGFGFVTSGQPTIYYQSPSGKVLLRVDSYSGPADLAGRLRKADPNYQPTADPTGGGPALTAGLTERHGQATAASIGMLGASLGLIYYLGRRQS